ncbi:MAG: ABC transporter permease [Aeromonadales bacterium]|nr:ABC transporter permease [Aeromonadales bacterium]
MILKLSFRSLWFEKLLNGCLVAALCAIIAPLLLLFSLRYGIVTNLQDNLKSDPRNLEIKMMSGYRLDKAFFDSLYNNQSVAFAIPLTRSLSVTANINFNGRNVLNLDTLPTKDGDPIVLKSGIKGTLSQGEAYLSETLVDDLKMHTGDEFRFVISRTKNGQHENAVIKLKLKGIIKKEYLPYKSVMVDFQTLIYMEDYRDGYNPPVFSDGTSLNTERNYFAKARIYVKTLDDVEVVSKQLRANYSISDKLSKIEELKAISRVLNFVFLLVASTSITGGIIAVFGLVYTNLTRQEKSFALLMLTGVKRFRILLIICIEYFVLSLIAYFISYLIYFVAMTYFNAHFENLLGKNTLVSTLNYQHLLCGFALVCVATLIVSALICRFKIFRIKIADCLRAL